MANYDDKTYQNQITKSGLFKPITQVKAFQWEQFGVEYFYYPGDHFLENSHSKIQITTPFTPSDFRASWQTAGGFGREQKLEEAAVCLIVSDQPHALRWDNYGEFASFYLTPQYLHYCVHDLIKGENVELVESFSQDPLLWQLGQSLRQELCQSDAQPSQLFVGSVINVVAVHLLRTYGVRQSRSLRKEGAGSGSSLNRTILKQVLDFIEANLSEDLSLEELARLVSLSPFHLTRSFKKVTGLSIHQYVLTRRVEAAKLLLMSTSLPLFEISCQTGFSNQSHFTTQFRRWVGTTPTLYRRTTKQ